VKYPSVIPVKNWKTFSSAEGKYSVWFPGTPEVTNIILTVSNIDFSQSCYFVWADMQTEYAVNCGDYPKNLEKLKPEQQFDICQSGVTGKIGKIVSQRDVKAGDYPSRDIEFIAGGKANYSGRIRLILANKRLYQIMVIFLTVDPHPADRDIFFNSFRVQN
jgi:hypothetical protein